MKKYRTSDKVMSRKLARKEARITKQIAKPKSKHLKIGRLSVYKEGSRVSQCTEGVWHDPIYFPAQIRIVWWGRVIRIKIIKLRRFYNDNS